MALSSIIGRKDDVFLRYTEKVKQYNELLVDVCAVNKWDLIDNKNIDHSHLTNYGLHLNRKGIGALAKNIKYFLSKNLLIEPEYSSVDNDMTSKNLLSHSSKFV